MTEEMVRGLQERFLRLEFVLQERVAGLERRVEAMADEMRAMQMFNQGFQMEFMERLSSLEGQTAHSGSQTLQSLETQYRPGRRGAERQAAVEQNEHALSPIRQ